jgi:hypothetical protein
MKKASEATIQYWQKHVEAFKVSGLTREAYCRENSIRTYQLDYWRKKFLRLKKTQAAVPAKQWVPLRITNQLPENNSHIDLWISHTVRIEIKPGFDPKLLNEIIHAVDCRC